MTEIDFHDWAWSDLLANTTTARATRLASNVTVQLAESSPADDEAPRSVDVDADFSLAGFDDVAGLADGAVTRRYPGPGAAGSESSRLALVEFADPALPWLYSPEALPGSRPRPWLVLVVGREGEDGTVGASELELNEDLDRPEVLLRPGLLQQIPPLAGSALWAHVQELDGRTVSRLICPRVLDPHTPYVAAVVPSFVVDAAGGFADAWGSAAGDGVRLPVYDHWRFSTGDDDDFLALALALEARVAAPHIGRIPLRYGRTPIAPRVLAEGALRSPIPLADAVGAHRSDTDPWSPEVTLPVEVGDDLRALRDVAGGDRRVDERGRPIVSLPDYGRRWTGSGDQPAPPWRETLNDDPRHRSASGVGAEAVIAEQTMLVDRLIERLGAHSEAAQRLSNLALGMAATRSLWRRRLPADDASVIELLGPAMARIATEHGPLLNVVAGPSRSLAPAVFSTAARRVFRAGPARGATTASGVPFAAVVEAANQCPKPPPDPVGLPTISGRPFQPTDKVDVSDLLRRAEPAPTASPRTREVLEALTEAIVAETGGGGQPSGSASLTGWRASRVRSACRSGGRTGRSYPETSASTWPSRPPDTPGRRMPSR